MLDTWYRQDDGTVKAKSRCVLIGWKDPMVFYQWERAAPTPTQEAIMVTLQWLASAKVSGHVTDLTTAFGQARKTKLAQSQFDCGSVDLRLCQEPVRHMSVHLVLKRRHLGQVLIDVDDFIEGGKEPHCKAMERFTPISVVANPLIFCQLDKKGHCFASRRVVQHRDYRVTVSMDEYIRNKFRPIGVLKGYL